MIDTRLVRLVRFYVNLGMDYAKSDCEEFAEETFYYIQQARKWKKSIKKTLLSLPSHNSEYSQWEVESLVEYLHV